jgi:coenzyme F420-0:L-glutamate ligase/coenzyme F420-1:gamma-L-glutamate ligase
MFSPEPVPRAVVDRLFRAASMAPSAANAQPWHFHVVDGERRQQIGEILAQATVHLEEYMDVLGPEAYQQAVSWFSELGGAPLLVGVSVTETNTELDTINALLSVGAAIENFLLAATAEGVGACNVTFGWWVRDELNAAFEVSADRSVVAMIALGHPRGEADMFPPKNPDVADWVG